MSSKRQMSGRMSRPRAFSRGEYLSIRIPEDDKTRLREQARKAKRDTSNLALEFLTLGMDAFDRNWASRVMPHPANGYGAINGQSG
jgi:hypothetical protein